MLYTLNQEEYNTLVPKSQYDGLKNDSLKVAEKLSMSLHYFKSGGECSKVKYNGFCDDCVISSLNMGRKGFNICPDEKYSK